MRAPYMMADSTSRPWLSVPSRYIALPASVHAGGMKPSERFRAALSNGLCGASQGANTAPPTQMSVSSAAMITTGERRKLQARSWFQARRNQPSTVLIP
jgi:hypothetical protein